MNSDIGKISAEMEQFVLEKWARTEVAVSKFSNDAENEMRLTAPGPDTGTLDKSIKSEVVPSGNFMDSLSILVMTKIEDNKNPNNGESAMNYGRWWNDGHYNIFLRRSVPPWYFMEKGSKIAYEKLCINLNSIWKW